MSNLIKEAKTMEQIRMISAALERKILLYRIQMLWMALLAAYVDLAAFN